MNDYLKKVSAKSVGLTEQNIEKLKKLFPEIITESKIDFEKLRVILGDQVDESPERYSFTWNGKKQAMKLAQQPTSATLKTNKEKSKNWDTTENLYIEGDNLEVLKLLQKPYFNKIKMIYIDPPYNTGKDFVYKDNFHDSMQNYLEQTGQVDSNGNKLNTNTEASGRYHTDWLNMMYPRLKLARNLLKEDGIMFISIGDSEQANLKKICDEIFGEINFVGMILWKKKTNGNNMGVIPPVHDYILAYSKDINLLCDIGYDISEDFISERYSNPDNDERGPWTTMDLSANHKGPYFPVKNPKNGEIFYPSEGRYWVFNEQEVARRIADERIIFGKSGNSRPVQKVFAKERLQGKIKSESWWDNQGLNSDATEEMRKLFGKGKVFPHPKPTKLIKNLVNISTTKEDIILDFFSGSSTTAEAVMRMNVEDEGDRKFIMVQFPEQLTENDIANKDGYRTIPEIAEERIRRAGDKIIEEDPLFADKLDIGFKVFELSKSNIKKWSGETQDLATEFELLEENFEEGSKPLDVVYEIMIKQGFDLTYPISEHQVGKAVVYDIAYGAMFVVLGDAITSEVAGFIVCKKNEQDREDVVVVLQDEKFVDDSEKLNMIEQLNANGIQYSNILSI